MELKKVLVVDDDAYVSELIGAVLSRLGMSVISAPGGEAALDILSGDNESEIDLVILDLMMPGCSGFEVLDAIRGTGLRDVPVMILTARMMNAESLGLIEYNPNVKQFWSKPFDVSELVHAVHKVLSASDAAA